MKKSMVRVLSILLTVAVLCSATVVGVSATNAVALRYGDTVLRTLYEPNTQLVGAPTVIETITTQEQLTQLAADERAQGVWLTLQDQATVALENEQTVSLDAALVACKERVLPVLQVENETVAQQLATFIADQQITDIMIASSDTAILSFLYSQQLPYVSLAYIASGNAATIANNAHACGANVCVLDNPTRETVEYIQARYLTVTVRSSTAKTTREQVDQVVECGGCGVVVNNATQAYDLYEMITAPTYIRKPYTIAHRGYSAIAPDNSLEGMKEAFENGADAMECDIYVTADNQLVCFHNPNLTGCTTDGATNSVESLTLAQLTSKVLNPVGVYNNAKIPALATLFEELKKWPDRQLVIEIKTSNTTVSQKIKALAEEYGVMEQITVIGFDANQCKLARQAMPSVGVSWLVSTNVALETSLALAANYNIHLDGQYDGFDSSYIAKLLHRGVTTNLWTVPPQLLGAQAVKGALYLTGNYVKESVALENSIHLETGNQLFVSYPYAENENSLMIYDGETTKNTQTNYGGAVSLVAGQQGNALQLASTTPRATDGTNVAAMVYMTLTTPANLASYDTITYDLWVPEGLTGTQKFQINFCDSSVNLGDGYNLTQTVSQLQSGWNTLSFTMASYKPIHSDIHWSNIDRLRITWFNLDTYEQNNCFRIDNLRAVNQSNLDTMEKAAIAQVEAAIDAIGEVTKENAQEKLALIVAAENALAQLKQTYPNGVVSNEATLVAARKAYDEFSQQTVLMGDVNNDTFVNAVDALAVLKFAVDKETFTDEQKRVANMNGDKFINAEDALAILKVAVGK